MQRMASPIQRRQCGEAVFRTLVSQGSVVLPLSAKAGEGMPHLAIANSRSPAAILTTGAG